MSFIAFDAHSVCSIASRADVASLSVLTSATYNNDLNVAYGYLNSLDGSCMVDDTIGQASLNTSDGELGVLTKTARLGCEVTGSAAQVTVKKCRIAVNGNLAYTTGDTTFSAGVLTASTPYYVYIKSTANGLLTSSDFLVSTTAPGDDGYDASNRRCLGVLTSDNTATVKFFSSGHQIESSHPEYVVFNKDTVNTTKRLMVDYFFCSGTCVGAAGTACTLDVKSSGITSVFGSGATGTYVITFAETMSHAANFTECWCNSRDVPTNGNCNLNSTTTTTATIICYTADNATITNARPSCMCLRMIP